MTILLIFALLIAGAAIGYHWGSQDKRSKGEARIMSRILDTQQYRISLEGVDADNYETGPLVNTTGSLDRPDLASLTADPASPGQFILRALPQVQPTAGPITVNVTLTDPNSGVSATAPYGFDASTPTSAVLVNSVEPIPAADVANPSLTSAQGGLSAQSTSGAENQPSSSGDGSTSPASAGIAATGDTSAAGNPSDASVPAAGVSGSGDGSSTDANPPTS